MIRIDLPRSAAAPTSRPFDRRSTIRRFVAAGVLALMVTGCGGGADESAGPTDAIPSAVDGTSVGAELAGVQIEVRRDPG